MMHIQSLQRQYKLVVFEDTTRRLWKSYKNIVVVIDSRPSCYTLIPDIEIPFFLSRLRTEVDVKDASRNEGTYDNLSSRDSYFIVCNTGLCTVVRSVRQARALGENASSWAASRSPRALRNEKWRKRENCFKYAFPHAEYEGIIQQTSDLSVRGALALYPSHCRSVRHAVHVF